MISILHCRFVYKCVRDLFYLFIVDIFSLHFSCFLFLLCLLLLVHFIHLALHILHLAIHCVRDVNRRKKKTLYKLVNEINKQGVYDPM